MVDREGSLCLTTSLLATTTVAVTASLFVAQRFCEEYRSLPSHLRQPPVSSRVVKPPAKTVSRLTAPLAGRSSSTCRILAHSRRAFEGNFINCNRGISGLTSAQRHAESCDQLLNTPPRPHHHAPPFVLISDADHTHPTANSRPTLIIESTTVWTRNETSVNASSTRQSKYGAVPATDNQVTTGEPNIPNHNPIEEPIDTNSEVQPLTPRTPNPLHHRFGWAVFWDLENTSIPRTVPIPKMIHALRDFISHHRNKTEPDPIIHIKAIGNIDLIPKNDQLQLFSNGVSLHHVVSFNRRKDLSDKILLTELGLFPLQQASPYGIALLSGDIDFSHCIARLTALSYYTMIIAPTSCSLRLATAPNAFYLLEEVLKNATVPAHLDVPMHSRIGDNKTRKTPRKIKNRRPPSERGVGRAQPCHTPTVDHSKQSPRPELSNASVKPSSLVLLNVVHPKARAVQPVLRRARPVSKPMVYNPDYEISASRRRNTRQGAQAFSTSFAKNSPFPSLKETAAGPSTSSFVKNPEASCNISSTMTVSRDSKNWSLSASQGIPTPLVRTESPKASTALTRLDSNCNIAPVQNNEDPISPNSVVGSMKKPSNDANALQHNSRSVKNLVGKVHSPHKGTGRVQDELVIVSDNYVLKHTGTLIALMGCWRRSFLLLVVTTLLYLTILRLVLDRITMFLCNTFANFRYINYES